MFSVVAFRADLSYMYTSVMLCFNVTINPITFQKIFHSLIIICNSKFDLFLFQLSSVQIIIFSLYINKDLHQIYRSFALHDENLVWPGCIGNAEVTAGVWCWVVRVNTELKVLQHRHKVQEQLHPRQTLSQTHTLTWGGEPRESSGFGRKLSNRVLLHLCYFRL